MNKLYDIVIDGMDETDMELLPYFDFGPINNITAHISLIKDIPQRNRIKTMIIENSNGVPFGIKKYSQCLSDYLSSRINPSNIYNYYYRIGDDLWCYFSYPTDDFCVHIHGFKLEVYGEMYNLCRVIKDILMVSSKIIPLHAASMSIGNKGFCLFGDSQAGKTHLAALLLKHGFRFISDDISFVRDNYLINVDREIWVRRDMLCNDTPFETPPDKELLYVKPQHVSTQRFIKLHKVFVLSKTQKNINSLRDLHTPFPIISLQSYWCSGLFNIANLEKHIDDQINHSVNYWEERLKDSITIVSSSDTTKTIRNIESHLKS